MPGIRPPPKTNRPPTPGTDRETADPEPVEKRGESLGRKVENQQA